MIYRPGTQETIEVWGIDRPAPGLPTVGAPSFTDADDPLHPGSACTPLLLMRDGDYVTWHRLIEWIGEATAAGYDVVSGFKKLSPYSTIVLRGP